MTTENTEQTTETVETTEQTTEQVSTPEKSENMIPKSRLDQEIQKRKAMSEQMSSLVEDLKQDIPEDMQDLIPDLAPDQQIAWIRNATKKGLFNTVKADGPDSNTPGPSNQDVDLSNMDAYNKLLYGFNK